MIVCYARCYSASTATTHVVSTISCNQPPCSTYYTPTYKRRYMKRLAAVVLRAYISPSSTTTTTHVAIYRSTRAYSAGLPLSYTWPFHLPSPCPSFPLFSFFHSFSPSLKYLTHINIFYTTTCILASAMLHSETRTDLHYVIYPYAYTFIHICM